MEKYCPNCFQILSDKHKINYKYQCDCFYYGDEIECYDIGDECCICFDKCKEKKIFYCGHWTCNECFMKIYNHDKNQWQCPLCNRIYGIELRFIKNYKLYEHKIDIPNEFINSFKKLYRRFINKIENYLFTNESKHHKMIILLEEYYKWLCIVGKYGCSKVSPGLIVDQLWHEHLLDNRDYNNLCIKLCGEIIYHEPEVINSSDRIERYEKTMEIYEDEYKKQHEFTNLEHFIWKLDQPIDIYQKYYGDKLVYVRDTFGRKCKYYIGDDMTTNELKIFIENETNIPRDVIVLIVNGRILVDNKKIKYYNIEEYDVIHVNLHLRGC